MVGARSHKPLVGSFSVLGDAAAAEVLARSGFGFVLVDLQHGLASPESLVSHLTAIEAAGALPFVRVSDQSPCAIGQALDRGADKVVVPLVDTAEQARAAVAACRHPPLGTRSYGPLRERTSGFGHPKDRSPCVVMAESVAAVEAIDEIAAVPGLGGIYVGPSDLAVDLGLGPEYDVAHPEHNEMIGAVMRACHRNGIAAGVHTPSPEVATRRIAEGFDLVSIRSDHALLGSAARAAMGGLNLLQ